MPKKQIVIILQSMLAMILYFIFLQVLDKGEHTISNLLLAFSFYMIVQYLSKNKEDIFSIDKIIIYIFFVLGIFLRVILIKIFNEDFQSFAYVKLENNGLYFINTSIIIFISVLFYIIGQKISTQKKIRIRNINNIQFKEDLLVMFYLILCLAVIIYKINNIRLATSGFFGTFDNIINIIGLLAVFISIVFLIKFFRTRYKKYLILFLLYVIPDSFISLVAGWKGNIIFTILLIFIILSTMKIKYSKKLAILTILCIFLIVFPAISMYRVNLIYNENIYDININAFKTYLIKNNPFRYLSNRFGYYDEIYLACNVDEATKRVYRDTSGLIHENILIGFVPRMIYKNKKIMNIGRHNAIILTKLPEEIYSNIAISYIGELFINYSYWGVAIFNLLLGITVGYITKSKGNDIISISKYAFFSYIILGFLEGGLAARIVGLLTMIVFINLLCFIFKIEGKGEYFVNTKVNI